MIKFEERESVTLENHGQKIFGILHLPHTPPPHPAVLMCHGLGGHKGGKFRLYVNLAERLSKSGIATLRIDFRGSGDSEGDFSDMTIESETSDAVVALEYLKNRPEIDNKRIGIFGRSVGGTVGMMAANQAGFIKTIAVWAPLYDGDQWFDQWQKLHTSDVSEEHRQENLRINGQVAGAGFFKQLFSLRMEDHLKGLESTPLLHIHGDLDHVVTTHHADCYVKSRSKVPGKNHFIRLPKSDHDFSQSKEQILALEETANWFAQTL